MQLGIIYLHGNPGSTAIFTKVQALIPNPSLCLNLPGLGKSQKSPPVSIDACVTDLREALSDFVDKQEKIIFVGHDWGGPLSAILASSFPEKTAGFIFFNTVFGEFDKLPLWLRFFGRSKLFSPIFVFFASVFGTAREKLAIFQPYLNLNIFNTANYIKLVPFDKDEQTNQFLHLLKSTNVNSKPALIIWGLNDLCIKTIHLADLESKFPNSKTVVNLSKHFSPLELDDRAKLAISAFVNSIRHKRDPFFDNELEVVSIINDNLRSLAHSVAIIEVNNCRTLEAVTFKELNAMAYSYQRVLRCKGLAGKYLLLAVKPWKNFVALFIACLREKVIPVLLDPKIELGHLIRALKKIPSLNVVTTPIGFILFQLLKFFGVESKTYCSVGDSIHGMSNVSDDREKHDICFVAFTSGGTGTPKPVVFTSKMLLAQRFIFQKYLEMSIESVDFPVTPAFFIHSLLLGRTSIMFNGIKTVSDYRFSDVIKILQIAKPSHLFASKFFWKKLLTAAHSNGTDLTWLKYGIISGAPLYRSFVESLIQLSDINLLGAYGSTEALPVSFYSLKESLKPNKGLYVGNPIEEVDVFIANSNQIFVSGPNVSENYLDPSLNSEFKLEKDGKIFHKMSDLGYFENGCLYLLGREKDSFLERHLYPYPLEDFVFTHYSVSDCVSVIRGEKIKLFVTTSASNSNITPENLEKAIKAEFNLDDVTVIIKDKIPYDLRHNSKPLRDKLSD
ncbi:MAG: alpha/beta fold hydrolase [Deltaproteobacteria bacterium]|nr:alpha/beta fold hydrolase [Deltaproteobacteria bacterium]